MGNLLRNFVSAFEISRGRVPKSVYRPAAEQNPDGDKSSEIKSRRLARLKKLHGEVNFGNDPDKELQKFYWLKTNNIITTQEYDQAVLKLQQWKATQQKSEVSQNNIN